MTPAGREGYLHRIASDLTAHGGQAAHVWTGQMGIQYRRAQVSAAKA